MQAARGASLNSSDTVSPGPFLRRRRWWLFAAIAVGAFVTDLLVKEWALRELVDRDIAVLGDWFTLHLVFNPGAAFGTGTEYTWVFTTLAFVAVLVVLWLSRRIGSTLWAIGLGALLGGVSGNLFDRIFREPEPFHGHVVDMFMLPNWPVFNVADICINVAAGVIILQTFRGIAINGTRDSDQDGEASDGPVAVEAEAEGSER